MTKYEYTYLRVTGTYRERLNELNAAGAEGWKVEGMEQVKGVDAIAFLLSRPLENKD